MPVFPGCHRPNCSACISLRVCRFRSLQVPRLPGHQLRDAPPQPVNSLYSPTRKRAGADLRLWTPSNPQLRIGFRPCCCASACAFRFLVPPREKRPRLAFILASAESEALPGARACFAGSTGAVLPVCAASAKRPCCYASNASSSAGKKSGTATKPMRVLKWCMCIGMPHAVQ